MDLQWFAHNKRVASRQSVLTPDSVGEEQGVASGPLPPAPRQSDGVLNRIGERQRRPCLSPIGVKPDCTPCLSPIGVKPDG